jgi:hypothetical protein
MNPVKPEKRPGTGAVVFAENQPEYIPLPANVLDDGEIETKWRLSWRERWQVFTGGHVYLRVLTFGRALQPVRLTATRDPDNDGFVCDAAGHWLGWHSPEKHE